MHRTVYDKSHINYCCDVRIMCDLVYLAWRMKCWLVNGHVKMMDGAWDIKITDCSVIFP